MLLVMATLSLGLALLGTNPLKPAETLTVWVRIAFAALGLALFLAPRFAGSRPTDVPKAPPSTAEYEERFRKTQQAISTITPEHKVVAERQIGGAMFQILSDDILNARVDVIVSSDDNHFTARGGVAKAIVGRAGSDVEHQLVSFRRHAFRQGDLAVTTGGNSEWRAVLHPAVIDLDENRYPTAEVLNLVVQRLLFCANAMGARRIAFPVLGGGTASKHMTAQESAEVMTQTIIAFLQNQRTGDKFSYVALYAFKADDASRAAALLNKVESPKVGLSATIGTSEATSAE